MGTWSEMTCEEERQMQRPRGELMGASGEFMGELKRGIYARLFFPPILIHL